MRITAMALLVALATGWSTAHVGLSLTLGAFLGRMIIAESLYWPLIHSAINPFRNLLLTFLLISVGLSLDFRVLLHAWPAVLAIAIVPIAAKVMLNTLASLSFRWSVPGSTQLGFLLVVGATSLL